MRNPWTIVAASGWLDAVMDSKYYNSIFNSRSSGIPQSIRYKGKKKRKNRK